jgi:hypothetical protein
MAFKYPKVEIQRINLRPLLGVGDLQRVNPAKILRSLQQSVLKRIRDKILQETFSFRAKKALYRGVSVKVGPNSITVIAKHPAFRPLLEGQRAGQMRWLLKSKKPIPIVTDDGTLIFRNATPRSMANGSWYHPGRKPTTVLERAKKEAREVIREKIGADLRKQIRAAFARSKS